MKSTQDLVIFLNKIEQALEIPQSVSVLSIEVFSDKSFRINKHSGDNVEIVYDSDNIPVSPGYGFPDINDFCYQDPESIANDIKESKEEKKDELDLS